MAGGARLQSWSGVRKNGRVAASGGWRVPGSCWDRARPHHAFAWACRHIHVALRRKTSGVFHVPCRTQGPSSHRRDVAASAKVKRRQRGGGRAEKERRTRRGVSSLPLSGQVPPVGGGWRGGMSSRQLEKDGPFSSSATYMDPSDVARAVGE